MKKYMIKAYGDYDRRLEQQEKVIIANDDKEAWSIAWSEFPEYDEVGVWEMTE